MKHIAKTVDFLHINKTKPQKVCIYARKTNQETETKRNLTYDSSGCRRRIAGHPAFGCGS